MAAQNGEGVYGSGVGVVTPLAHKLSQNGPLVKDSTGKPRSGVFYAGNASLVTGKANMSYDVAVFEAAICRGRTKGTSFPTNDAVVNVATTAAPGSNSRIDIIYFQQKEVSEGDDATEAVVGVVQGTAASSPSAPTLPDGAIELARAVVPAGITATTSATITQTAPYTTTAGGVLPFRTTTERDAFSPLKGQLAYLLDSDSFIRHTGSAWTRVTPQILSGSAAAPATNAGAVSSAIPITFSPVFASAPKVFVTSTAVRLTVAVDQITTSGANIYVANWSGANQASGPSLNWVAIGV